MSEIHMQCTQWPRCRIHLGRSRPREFSIDNRKEMNDLYNEGWLMVEIAQAFDTKPGTVAMILGKRRR